MTPPPELLVWAWSFSYLLPYIHPPPPHHWHTPIIIPHSHTSYFIINLSGCRYTSLNCDNSIILEDSLGSMKRFRDMVYCSVLQNWCIVKPKVVVFPLPYHFCFNIILGFIDGKSAEFSASVSTLFSWSTEKYYESWNIGWDIIRNNMYTVDHFDVIVGYEYRYIINLPLCCPWWFYYWNKNQCFVGNFIVVSDNFLSFSHNMGKTHTNIELKIGQK